LFRSQSQPVPHLPPGCSRRAGGKRPWGVRERAGADPTQNVLLGSRVVSQKVNFLGQGNKGGSSRRPLGEQRANILLLACCYQEGWPRAALAVAVRLPALGTITLHIQVDVNLDDFVRRQEAILNALLQGIGVSRLPEIMDVGDVGGFLRCRREADLRGGGEVFEDLAPGRILGSAATVALVNDDQVEEARRKLPKELLALLRPGDGLIEAEIDLVGGVNAALGVERGCKFVFGAVLALDGLRAGAEFCHCRAERAEVVDHGLVNKDITVGKKENAFLADRNVLVDQTM